jgi:hypothetical protein
MASRLHSVSSVIGVLFIANLEVAGQIHSRILRAPHVCDSRQLDCHLSVHVRRVEGIEDNSPPVDLFGPWYNTEVARFYSCCSCHRTVHPGYAIRCAKSSNFVLRGSGLTVVTVDSTIPDYLNAVLGMGISMLAKFVAVVVFSPVFLLPGVAAFVIGALVGQVYIKAQLSVKREMSNARSPVLSHFGAAIAGIGACVLSD